MNNTSRTNPQNSINNVLNSNINSRFQNSNSEFKYEFFGSNKLFEVKLRNSELKCQFLDSNNYIQN
jgi:hypothetical protein